MTHAIHDLEQSVIGCVILDPQNLALLPTLELYDFETVRGRCTWAAIRNLEAVGSPIDIELIAVELDKRGEIDAVGWPYLRECELRVPIAMNATAYARLLRDHALKRRIQFALAEIIEHAKDAGANGGELLSMTLAAVSRMDTDQPDAAKTIGEIVRGRMKQLEVIAADRANGTCTLTGYSTGVDVLDGLIGGWQPGIVSIVAARPGMGKSSLGLATADGCSEAGHGVHLFSLEDTESAYADRSISRLSSVPAEKIRNIDLNRIDMHEMTHAVAKLNKRNGWLVDGRSGISADEIVRSVRRNRRANDTRVVIVDYVQLVKFPRHSSSSHEALTEIVTTFADAAKQDGLAYVVMSQLNRQLETRSDKRPQLSDLRESGSLEERAKCVVALYRGSVYSKEPGRNDPESRLEWHRRAELLVLKNSNGRTGFVEATWDGPCTRLS